MAEVTVTGEKEETTGAVYNFFEYTRGVADAINSNFFPTYARTAPTSQANAYGQFNGDMLSVAASIFEIGIGAGGTGIGIMGSPTGVGVGVAAGSVAVAAHGSMALGNSIANLQGSYLRFAKKYDVPDDEDDIFGNYKIKNKGAGGKEKNKGNNHLNDQAADAAKDVGVDYNAFSNWLHSYKRQAKLTHELDYNDLKALAEEFKNLPK